MPRRRHTRTKSPGQRPATVTAGRESTALGRCLCARCGQPLEVEYNHDADEEAATCCGLRYTAEPVRYAVYANAVVEE